MIWHLQLLEYYFLIDINFPNFADFKSASNARIFFLLSSKEITCGLRYNIVLANESTSSLYAF